MCVYRKETDVQRCPFGTTGASRPLPSEQKHCMVILCATVLSSPCFSLFRVRWLVATQTHLGGVHQLWKKCAVPRAVKIINAREYECERSFWLSASASPLAAALITGTGAGSAWRPSPQPPRHPRFNCLLRIWWHLDLTTTTTRRAAVLRQRLQAIVWHS